MLAEGEFALGKAHGAQSLLMDSVALREKAVAKMKADPFCFIDDSNKIFKK